MKNKKINLLIILCSSVFMIKETRAFEIPSYIEDPQKVSDNINIIIEQNTPKRGTVTDAQEMSKQTQETIAEYAARLYAEALSIRASMSNEDGGEDVSENTMGSTNKQEILQNNVKSQVKNIALRLKQIVELETAIVNLQSTQLLAGMDEVSTSNSTSEEAEQ